MQQLLTTMAAEPRRTGSQSTHHGLPRSKTHRLETLQTCVTWGHDRGAQYCPARYAWATHTVGAKAALHMRGKVTHAVNTNSAEGRDAGMVVCGVGKEGRALGMEGAVFWGI